jgi:phosphonate transport system substrate-binding protein
MSRGTQIVLRAVLYGAAAAAIATVVYMAIRYAEERSSLKESQDQLVAQIGLIHPVPKRIVPGYVDADGGLVADPPGDPAKLVDPEELVVAHYDGDEDDTERVNWDAFQQFLGQATGKKVACRPYVNSVEDVEAIKSGKIHLVALHAADVPYLVNNAGFVPLAVLGSKAGASGNHLVVAVSRQSKIRSLAEVRGRTLTCTRPDSITGYRAAIAILSQEAGLMPQADYRFHFSHGQKRSIRGLVDGDFEVAALSADKIQEMLADGSLKKSDIRVIYESQVIPRLTIGHVYHLKPELAARVAKSVLEFDNPAAGDSSEGPMRFFAIDYQTDFVFPRRIDDSFDPRFGQFAGQGP